MSTITREFTKEQLIEHIKGRKEFADECAADSTLHPERREYYELTAEALRIAQASLEAEPVAYIFKHPAGRLFWSLTDESNKGQSDVMPVYAAPPAPVSVPDAYIRDERGRMMLNGKPEPRIGYGGGWNACRSAMLQGAEPVTTAYRLPMQPLAIDDHGTLRFKENPIVRKLLDYATEHGYGLNEIALDEFEAEDQMQLAQLIGYSLSGYGSLSYVTDESYDRATAAAPKQEVK